MQALAVVLMVAGATALVAALIIGHRLITKADRERWLNRAKPRALLRDRPRTQRAVVALLIAAAVLAVAAQILTLTSESNPWLFAFGIILPVESLILLDMLQHRAPEPVA